MSAETALASALAEAMLAGTWHRRGLIRAMSATLNRTSRRVRWVRPLAVEVLAAYPHPPLDRPRELAGFVGTTPAVQRALGRRRPPKALVRVATPTTTVSRPFPTPRVDHVAQLAEFLAVDPDELVLLADPQSRARRAPSRRIAHYRYHWLDKPAGARLLEAPKPRLKALQRKVLDGLLTPIPVHPAAHGFVPGRSAVTGAAPHVGAAVVVTVDLEHFFAAVRAGRVWGVLRAAGYPEPVAHLLTALTTHASPVATLSAMPPGPDRGRDFRLRRRLATPHLPQGAPTSPQLANLVAFSLDRRLDAYARAAGVTYTRYADDLTFSGGPELSRAAEALLHAVDGIVRAAGYRLNPAKTRIRRSHERQSVTGIVVNRHTTLARPEYDRLRAVLHDCVTNGPEAADRNGHDDFRAHLLGRISWVAALHPARGARLRAAFDAVAWGD
ncbi:reverse transcriptase family protein [Nakamurella deserti]|uniref:reverse transcriptase family protein n=1 Tax=Nakamurella deserti TaxID=2164074 RepID=UPI000DBE3E2B|nr:reverse transcriptase family protein [Nakamurella deserti]